MRSLAGSAVVLALLVSLFGAVGLTEHASAAEPDEIGAAEGSKPLPNPQSSCAICVANSEISGLQRPPTMLAPGECTTGSRAGELSRGRQAPMCAS
jgi:hypothetical protein